MPTLVPKELRGLRVGVLHPPDETGATLVEQLRAAGCNVSAVWPIPHSPSTSFDVVLLALDRDSHVPPCPAPAAGEPAPTLLAVIGDEDPSLLQLVARAGAHGIVERPVQPFGLLARLVVARTIWRQQQDAARLVRRLERRLAGTQRIQRAQLILMTSQQLSEDMAYQSIRRQAMSRRLSIEAVAEAIILAGGMPGAQPDDG